MNKPERLITDLKKIEELLHGSPVGRLGTSVENNPYVVPLCFVYHEGRIYFHSAHQGKKLVNLETNENVCFEVDESQLVKAANPCDFTMRYWSVIAYGKARIVRGSNDKLAIMKMMVEKYDPEKTAAPLTDKTVSNITVVEIIVDWMTGKKNELTEPYRQTGSPS